MMLDSSATNRKIHATIEHIIPRSYKTDKAGKQNYKISCYTCNHTRGDMEFNRFYELRQKYPNLCDLKKYMKATRIKIDWERQQARRERKQAAISYNIFFEIFMTELSHGAD